MDHFKNEITGKIEDKFCFYLCSLVPKDYMNGIFKRKIPVECSFKGTFRQFSDNLHLNICDLIILGAAFQNL